MSQAAQPGIYQFQPQTLGPAGAQNPQGCTNGACCVPSTEAHYNAKGNPGTTGTGGPTNTQAIDGPNTGTLPNRMAVEFYNAGTVVFEISNQSGFTYGDGSGRPVQPNTPYAFNIGPAKQGQALQHFIACSSSGPCDVRITEVGGNCD